MIGLAVGPYKVVKRLGAGAMGEVFLALDTRLHRQVALKCVATRGSAGDDFRSRRLHEARAAARLNHPNIAGIYDVIEQDECVFIVMEYVEGKSLAATLAGDRLPVDQVRSVGRQLAAALAAAHAQGVIHRDLKPANIQVTPSGSIKVLDFGVAKMTAGVGPGEGMPEPTIGGHPGTPIYMSPEQLFGKAIDVRSDIYSAGVILFEMATGRRPYEPLNAVGLAMAMSSGPASRVRSINTDVPADLDDTIAKMLQRDPAKRFQSATELEHALATTGPNSLATTMTTATDRSRRGWLIATAAAVLALIGSVGGNFVLHRTPASVAGITDIAVLPFANLSADPSQEYLADGMTEAIITELGRVRSLRIISRQSVMRYRGTATALPQIAKELAVTAIVTGSIARAADRVRVTVALVRASPERELWSDVYDRGVGDMLTLSSQVAQDTLDHISATVTPQERVRLARSRPLNPGAQQAYLLGRFFWNKRTKPDSERAIQEFEKAIALDSGAAVAFAGLADCFVVAWDNGYIPPEEAYRQAKANATRALALDETVAEAHASLGAVYSFSLLWAPAEQEYQRALELNPGYATAHQWYALNLSILGRHEEAVAEATRALSLDPLSPTQNAFRGQRLYFAGDYAAAVDQLKHAVELDPNFSHTHDMLGRTYLEQGQYAAAVNELKETSRLEGHVSGDLGYALAVAGDTAGAMRVLRGLLELSSRQYVSPKELALVYVGLHDPDRALDYLEKAYKEREGVVSDLVVDPRFVSISRSPRFQAILRKSGLNFVAGLPKGGHSHG